MSSDSSLLGGTPPSPMLRSRTSVPIITVMNRSRRPAAPIMASSKRPYHRESVSIDARVTALSGLLEEFLELRPGDGTLTDDAVPPGPVGLRDISVGHRLIELDGLNARCGLTLGFPLVLRREFRDSLGLAALCGFAQHVFLRLAQPIPRALVDEDRHFRGVEAGIDPVLRFLVPAEVEHAGDRPAVAVDDAALECRVDLARCGLDDGAAEGLEEIAVHRRDPKLEAGEVRARDRLFGGGGGRGGRGAAAHKAPPWGHSRRSGVAPPSAAR